MKRVVMIILIVGIMLSVGTVGAYLYTATNVTYSNLNVIGSNTQQAIEVIYDKACPTNAICHFKKSWANVMIGDYVQMTPTKSNYTTDKNITGYSSTQTIYPQELKLWRVIRKNQDGTIDLVSENVSSTSVNLTGKTGYINLIAYLNTLASQYENSTYTVGSRYMGYNGQTETITNTILFSSSGAPWSSSTTSTLNQKPEGEDKGGGDTLYATDVELVKIAYGNQDNISLIAKKCNDTNCSNPSSIQTYWLASRYYEYLNERTRFSFDSRYVNTDGLINSDDLYLHSNKNWYASNVSYALRPIITLKSGLSVSDAFGTKDHPFILG